VLACVLLTERNAMGNPSMILPKNERKKLFKETMDRQRCGAGKGCCAVARSAGSLVRYNLLLDPLTCLTEYKSIGCLKEKKYSID
jgi:hypothetical protein